MNKRPGGALTGGSGNLTNSQLLPLLSKWRELGEKAYFWPMVITVLSVVAMLLVGQAPSKVTVDGEKIINIELSPFLWLVALYLYGIIFYLTYRLCGKQKAWWVLIGTAIVTGIILDTSLHTPFLLLFRKVLPGDLPDPKEWGQFTFTTLLYKLFFGAGLMEELMKAVPVLLALWIGTKLKSPARERGGVWEPLDGILIGAASATAFAFLETMQQYVPQRILENLDYARVTDLGNGMREFVFQSSTGLESLVPRALGEAFGHIAYSGYLGYFIGFAVLRPAKRWQVLAIGYASAAGLHALWDASRSTWLLIVIGALSYAFLAAAILKARDLSPTPNQLRPSVLGAIVPKVMPENKPAQNAQPQVVVTPKANVTMDAPGTYLIVGAEHLQLGLGRKLAENELRGLKAQLGDALVAEVNANPQDPGVLGLKNLSTTPWTATDVTGEAREIPSGRSFALTAGMSIRFGVLAGEIQVIKPPQAQPSLTARGLATMQGGTSGPILVIAGQRFALPAGARLKEPQIPGLRAQSSDGIVAEVNQNPHDPAVLGLKNLSTGIWTAMDPTRELREIPTGRSLALVPGTKIDFGSENGEIE